MSKKIAGATSITEIGTSSRAGITPKQNIIRRTVAKLLIPFIQLFGIYVVIHGELGPGGGFQGGVVLGVSVIIFILVFGIDEARRRISRRSIDILMATGVLLFGGIGILCLIAGGNYLQYNVLIPGNPKLSSHLAIMAVEIGIGITVAAVMITLFCETVRRRDD